jgi:hypothetical protein
MTNEIRPVVEPTADPVAEDEAQHRRFSRRVEALTLGTGFAAALALLVFKSRAWGAGVAFGAVLAWLNYRWLDAGLDALVMAAKAQQGKPQVRVPAGTYWRFAFRYLLIAVAAYGIVTFLHVPTLAVISGLMALGAAVTIEGLYEVFSEPV